LARAIFELTGSSQELIPRRDAVRVQLPLPLHGLQQVQVEEAEDRRIEVRFCQAPDLGERGLPLNLFLVDLVGDEDQLFERRHARPGRRVRCYRAQDLALVEAVVPHEHSGGDRPVQEDRRSSLDAVRRDLVAFRQLEQSRPGLGPRQVVAQHGDEHAPRIDAMEVGQA
jgi:hypothetical protein